MFKSYEAFVRTNINVPDISAITHINPSESEGMVPLKQ